MWVEMMVQKRFPCESVDLLLVGLTSWLDDCGAAVDMCCRVHTRWPSGPKSPISYFRPVICPVLGV